MSCIFLDESGDPGFNEASTKYLFVSGVIFEDFSAFRNSLEAIDELCRWDVAGPGQHARRRFDADHGEDRQDFSTTR